MFKQPSLSQLTPEVLRSGRTGLLEELRQVTCAVIAHLERHPTTPEELQEQREMVKRVEAELRRRNPRWTQYNSTN